MILKILEWSRNFIFQGVLLVFKPYFFKGLQFFMKKIITIIKECLAELNIHRTTLAPINFPFTPGTNKESNVFC